MMNKMLGLLMCAKEDAELLCKITQGICEGFFLACQTVKEEKKALPSLKY